MKLIYYEVLTGYIKTVFTPVTYQPTKHNINNNSVIQCGCDHLEMFIGLTLAFSSTQDKLTFFSTVGPDSFFTDALK